MHTLQNLVNVNYLFALFKILTTGKKTIDRSIADQTHDIFMKCIQTNQ